MRIFLDIDSETIARLDAIGAGNTYGQSAEILGMALLEAYQMKRARERATRANRRRKAVTGALRVKRACGLYE